MALIAIDRSIWTYRAGQVGTTARRVLLEGTD
jgi:hypothetical protein